MTRHNTIGTDFQALVLLTITYAVKENVAILLTSKNIQPLNDGKCDKVKFILIANFIITTHRDEGLLVKVTNFALSFKIKSRSAAISGITSSQPRQFENWLHYESKPARALAGIQDLNQPLTWKTWEQRGHCQAEDRLRRRTYLLVGCHR